jgi:hypothetical protein
MAFLIDNVFDAGLAYADTNGTQIDITSSEATNITEAITTFTLGNDTVNTGAPEAGDVDGRKVVVPAITAGSVTGTGTAAFWALSNGTSILVATGPLTATQGVTSGNTFTLDAIDITLRDATAV